MPSAEVDEQGVKTLVSFNLYRCLRVRSAALTRKAGWDGFVETARVHSGDSVGWYYVEEPRKSSDPGLHFVFK